MSKSKGWMIKNVGPGRDGVMRKTVREAVGSGHCDNCGQHKKTLYSYTDDDKAFCNDSCWTSDAKFGSSRQPSEEQLEEDRRVAAERKAQKATRDAQRPMSALAGVGLRLVEPLASAG